MNQVIIPLQRFHLCKKCVGQIQIHEFVVGYISKRNISQSVPLMRIKRQQRPYQPNVPDFTTYGQTHRLARGESMNFKRYGPLFDKPDYTFLDGRPTPLSPEQREEREKRRQMAEKVMKCVKDIKDVKDFNAKKSSLAVKQEQLAAKRLKPKS